jgi:hypothetical protein
MLLGISYGAYLAGWAKTMVATMDSGARTGSKPGNFVFRDRTLTGDALDAAGNDVAAWAGAIDRLYEDARNAGLTTTVAATATACRMVEFPDAIIDEALEQARQYDGINEQVIAFLGVVEGEHFALMLEKQGP